MVVGLVLLNTAGPGLFSMSFTSPYKQQDIRAQSLVLALGALVRPGVNF